MKIATKFKIINGRIQLFDKDGNKLKGKGTKWNGWFDCYNNPALTSLEGAPESVGGGFNCSNNPALTSLEGAPESNKPLHNSYLLSAFLKKGMVFCDGILTRKISVKIKLDLTIYKTSKLGFKKKAPIVYVCIKGQYSAHGNTLNEALADLAFKSISKDVKQFRNMPKDTTNTPQEWGFIYRAITGACQSGVNMFIESKGKLKKKYSLSEILEQTKGAYGHDKFKEAVK